MFEQNRQKIAHTQEIISQIDYQLSDYLAQRGILTSNPDRVFENQLEQVQQRNIQIYDENYQIKTQIAQYQQKIAQIKSEFQENLNLKLKKQHQEMQQQFEIKIQQFGDKARSRLINTLQEEDSYIQQYNNLVNDKTLIQQQLNALKNQNGIIQKEKYELEGSYQSLLQMHNQLLQVDVSQNEMLQNKSGVLNLLNNYKIELEQLRQANEQIQKQMGTELDTLKNQLNKQKVENESLLVKVQQNSLDRLSNERLYEKIFNQTPPKKKKQKPRISKSKMRYMEKELKRLQELINSKIQQKKSKIPQ